MYVLCIYEWTQVVSPFCWHNLIISPLRWYNPKLISADLTVNANEGAIKLANKKKEKKNQCQRKPKHRQKHSKIDPTMRKRLRDSDIMGLKP